MFDFYAQRRYLTELRRKNEIVGRRLEEARMQKEREEAERQKTVEKVNREEEYNFIQPLKKYTTNSGHLFTTCFCPIGKKGHFQYSYAIYTFF